MEEPTAPVTEPTATVNPPWDDLDTVLRHAQQAQADRDAVRAHTFYVRATELDSNHPDAWAGRATTAPDLDEELLSWAYALALMPDNIQAKIRLEQAVSEKSEDSTLTSAAGLIALARQLAEAGQQEYAYRLAVRATELDDTKEPYWLWRAGLTSDLKETISCLNQALALNPDNPQAQAGLKWALAQQSKETKPATPSTAEEAKQFVEAGRAELEKGERAFAYDLFKRATELDQNNAQAWFLRGASVEETDVDEALTCMEQALAIAPDLDEAKEKRSWLRVRKLRESASMKKPAPAATARVAAVTRPPVPIRMDRVYLIVLLLAIIGLIALLIFILRPS